jgi:hypothetical protein
MGLTLGIISRLRARQTASSIRRQNKTAQNSTEQAQPWPRTTEMQIRRWDDQEVGSFCAQPQCGRVWGCATGLPFQSGTLVRSLSNCRTLAGVLPCKAERMARYSMTSSVGQAATKASESSTGGKTRRQHKDECYKGPLLTIVHGRAPRHTKRRPNKQSPAARHAALIVFSLPINVMPHRTSYPTPIMPLSPWNVHSTLVSQPLQAKSSLLGSLGGSIRKIGRKSSNASTRSDHLAT